MAFTYTKGRLSDTDINYSGEFTPNKRGCIPWKTRSKIREMKSLGKSAREISESFGVCLGSVYSIINNRNI